MPIIQAVEERFLSRKGLKFLVGWEGFSPRAVDIGDGTITIGYGTTQYVHPEIKLGDKINKRKARRWVRQFVQRDVIPLIPHRFHMKQQEIDALCSAAYNLGTGFLTDTQNSTFARRMRTNEADTFAGRKRIYRDELPKWVSPGSQFEAGLRKRREAEIELACRGRYDSSH